MFCTAYMDVMYAIVKVYSQKHTMYMDVLYTIVKMYQQKYIIKVEVYLRRRKEKKAPTLNKPTSHHVTRCTKCTPEKL